MYKKSHSEENGNRCSSTGGARAVGNEAARTHAMHSHKHQALLWPVRRKQTLGWRRTFLGIKKRCNELLKLRVGHAVREALTE